MLYSRATIVARGVHPALQILHSPSIRLEFLHPAHPAMK